MGLEMRTRCEKCDTALQKNEEAYICVHECTFCLACTKEMNFICKNCEGELVRRPKPKK